MGTNSIRSAAGGSARGVTPQAAHRWRRKDVDFAQAWSEALALGYEMLETLPVGHALSGNRHRRSMAAR